MQQAAASGRWPADLRRHADGCPSCREVLLVTSALSRDVTAPPRRLSPSILWAKARHARRRKAESVAARIVIWGQVTTGAIGIGVLAYLASTMGLWAELGTASAESGRVVAWMMAGAGAVTVVSLLTLRWVTRQG